MGIRILQVLWIRKRVYLLTDHQALLPLLKKNRAHKQYSVRLTRWLGRLSQFNVNVHYTAGENIPLTDYLSRHSIVPTEITELEKQSGRIKQSGSRRGIRR